VEKVGDILRGLYESSPALQHAADAALLFSEWDKQFAPEHHDWARLEDFKDGRLIIQVVQGVRMHNMSFLGLEIQEKLNKAIGRNLVSEVVFRRLRS